MKQLLIISAWLACSFAVSAQTLTTSITGTNVLCYGNNTGSANLTVSGGTPPYSYLWSNGATTEDLNNLTVGMYCVTVTDNNSNTSSTCVTITQPPAMTYSTDSEMPTCQGNYDGRVVISVSGGTLPYTYNWSNGGSISNTLICGAGNYAVTVADANNCTIIDTALIDSPTSIIVNPNPTQYYVCIGHSTSLSAQAFGGTPSYTYEWVCTQTGDTYTGANVNVAFQTSGNYYFTVIAYDAHDCASNPRTVSVHVYPPISATITASANTICPGDTISFTANISGGNGGPYMCSLQNGQVVAFPFSTTPNAQDTVAKYIFTISDLCGSPAGIDTAAIILLPLPDANFTTDILSGNAPLTIHFMPADYSNDNTYYWNFHDGVSFDPNPSHTFTIAGVYDISLHVTYTSGCYSSLVNENMITVNPAGENENNFTDLFAINPNPAYSIISIEINSTGLSQFKIKLQNILGETVYYSDDIKAFGNIKNEINVQDISPGIYLLQIVSGKNAYSKKIVIENK